MRYTNLHIDVDIYVIDYTIKMGGHIYFAN